MLDLGTSILNSVERIPNALAITNKNKTLSYIEWFNVIDRLSGSLKDLGLKKGDKLITLLQNNFESSSIHWACQFNGVIIIPLNWRMKASDIDFCIIDSEPQCIVAQKESLAEINKSLQAPKIIQLFVNLETNKPNTFESLIKNGQRGNLPQAKAEDLSLILYTSGTTGKPKGVPRTHSAERSSSLAHITQNLYEPKEITLGVMPLYHTMGIRSLISMTLINGTFVTQPKFVAEEALELIQKHNITSLYLVPTLFHELIGLKTFAKEKVVSCNKLGFAGAPMSDGLIQRVVECFQPKQLVNHYGSSEIYTFTVDQNAEKKPGSAGKSGINQRIRVVKLGSKNPEQINKIKVEGEIIADLKSDEAFSGYWKRPDADKKSIIKNWYFTNDMGYFDEEGDLFVTGRVDDMIITGGENVSPIEIENVLSLHNNILEVVIVGIPDEKWGQKICAFIVKSSDITTANLDKFCNKSGLTNFKKPKTYCFIKEIPKSPTGKILRRKLLAGEYSIDK
tara:strand:- start:259 stop:1782 length:1524 start_codon:yes stop_codon:yes gene_type:complete